MIRIAIVFLLFLTLPAHAEAPKACDAQDHLCLMAELEALIPSIENQSWKDKSLRELAKSYTAAGQEDKALALIPQVENADTKAMTIRGIGFAAADAGWPEPARYTALFEALVKEAQKIDHPPSQGIAWTYIAMAQAFAGDDAGATATAKAMTNEALRNKAFGENAEIQAERGDVEAALASIGHIKSEAFRNKSYRLVSKILMEGGHKDDAYKAAGRITNAYTKAEALQFIIGHEDKE